MDLDSLRGDFAERIRRSVGVTSEDLEELVAEVATKLEGTPHRVADLDLHTRLVSPRLATPIPYADGPRLGVVEDDYEVRVAERPPSAGGGRARE